jgi:hypothetical protein
LSVAIGSISLAACEELSSWSLKSKTFLWQR